MIWTADYQVPTLACWKGRKDAPAASYVFQLIQLLNLNEDININRSEEETTIAFGLIGFCCDTGISRNSGRVGAIQGPQIIREMLAKLAMHKQDVLCYDAGDILCTNHDLETAQAALGDAVSRLLSKGITPIVLGGGHELAFGHYQGIAKSFYKENLGIVNFDAHFDMRPLLPANKGSSGTPFLQIAQAHEKENRRFDYNCIGIQQAGNTQDLFDTAKKYGAHFILADDIHQHYREKCITFVDRVIDDNQMIYISLCLDVLASAYAPGVSASQALGLTPWQIMIYLRQLAASGKVISYDIAELSPKYDIDHRTAKLAAHFIHDIFHHHIPMRLTSL